MGGEDVDVPHRRQLSGVHPRECGLADGPAAAEAGDVVQSEEVGVDGHGQERGLIVDAAAGAKQVRVRAEMMRAVLPCVPVGPRDIIVTRERELENHVSDLRRGFEERRG